jgi:pilus assembly protein CpaF
MVGELVARISGFGPLQPYLDDDSVEEIWINEPSWVRWTWPVPTLG